MPARTGPHPPVHCTGCGVQMRREPRRKGTKCRACSDEERRVKPRNCQVCGIRLELRNRGKGTHCKICYSKTDERRESVRRTMLENHKDPAYRQKRGRAITAAKLQHIPLEYREEYLRLTRTTGMTAVEREQAIRNQMEKDAATFTRTGVLPQSSRAVKGEGQC